jgi:hypothetical protein
MCQLRRCPRHHATGSGTIEQATTSLLQSGDHEMIEPRTAQIVDQDLGAIVRWFGRVELAIAGRNCAHRASFWCKDGLPLSWEPLTDRPQKVTAAPPMFQEFFYADRKPIRRLFTAAPNGAFLGK